MQVIVSAHAAHRLEQRLRIRPRKMVSFAHKVWVKGTDPSPGWVNHKAKLGHTEVIYKILMGYIFAFAPHGETVVLKTILPRKHDNDIL